MGKKKKTKGKQIKRMKTIADYPEDPLVTMPIGNVIGLMLNDPRYAPFAYPYRMVVDVHTFIDDFENQKKKCLADLMCELQSSDVMNGTTLTMDRRATIIFKKTAKTASFQQLDKFKAQAETMQSKLQRAQDLMEAALASHPEMEEYRKEMLRNVMLDAMCRLTQTFDFLIKNEDNSDA